MKIVVCDPIDPKALDRLRAQDGVEVHVCAAPPSESELAGLARDAAALIVRSGTKVTAGALKDAGGLRVIGRAGAGVDNVDLKEATRRGILVVNTPGGNSVAAAEHALSLMLSLARHIPAADRSVRSGLWERKKFTGVEMAGKTLGILGLGRVGREVARRALAFRMKVLAHDPHVPSQVASDLGAEPASVGEILENSDFITLHLPLTDQTRHLIDADALARMRPGVRIVNCARGGLIDEAALARALDEGKVAGAAIDVFAQEPPSDSPLVGRDDVVTTPHLGASTIEAQRRVGEEIIEKVLNCLTTGLPVDAVNFPALPAGEAARMRPLMGLGERLGAFLSQISSVGMKRLELRMFGEFAEVDPRPVTLATVKGALEPVLQTPLGYVNALSVAADRGLAVEETVSREPVAFSSLLELRLWGDRGEEISASAAIFSHGEARIVAVDGIDIEAPLAGTCLFYRNRDVPGVVGAIGTILGGAGVNIASMGLGRHTASGTALSIVSVDSELSDDVLDTIRARDEIEFAARVRL